MRSRVFVVLSLIGWTVAGAQPSPSLPGTAAHAERAGARQAGLSGISYSIDTLPDGGPTPGILKSFSGVVMFAAGRGRLDVVGVGATPTIRVDRIVISPPLATPGEYYLFDSTGYILVRPSTKTFSSFWFVDGSYNFQERREGWPEYFEFAQLHSDSLGADLAAEVRLQHGPYPVYWHLDGQGRELARGRYTVSDAPAGELSVIRWFGGTLALGNLPAGVDTAGGGPLTITSLSLWPSATEKAPPTNITGIHRLVGLKRTRIDPSSMVLPGGFTETGWPGYEKLPQIFPLSSDNGMKWRRRPSRPPAR